MDYFKNIEFLGMLCLGAFVGGILNYGLSKIKDENSFSKIVTTIFGAAFSGVVFVFLEWLMNQGKMGTSTDSQHIYMYPIGLILALLWAQIPGTLDTRIKSENLLIKSIGILHVLGISLLTILILWSLFGTTITQG